MKNRSLSFSERDALSRDLIVLVSLDQTPVDCVPFEPGVVDVEFGVLVLETGRDVVFYNFLNFSVSLFIYFSHFFLFAFFVSLFVSFFFLSFFVSFFVSLFLCVFLSFLSFD